MRSDWAYRDLLDPGAAPGAVVYALAFILAAWGFARMLRAAVARLLARVEGARVDRTGTVFLAQLGEAGIYILAIVLYAHLVPTLRHFGTALLTGMSVATVVVGLAAQNTLGNVIAGISLLLYRPIRVGDRVIVGTPGGPAEGTVELLSLGYTFIRGDDGRRIVVPNSTMATQVTVNLNTVDRRDGVV